MRKKTLSIVFLFIMAIGYGIYVSQDKDNLSDLALANIEALASDYELPELEVTCNGKGGVCWRISRIECTVHKWSDCEFSGYQHESCLSPC